MAVAAAAGVTLAVATIWLVLAEAAQKRSIFIDMVICSVNKVYYKVIHTQTLQVGY